MSRREKRQQLSQWLKALFFQAQPNLPRRRPILVEPLETRQLLAADGFMALLGSSYQQQDLQPDPAQTPAQTSTQSNAGQLVTAGLIGEGEPAEDLVGFAKALTDSGTRYFGAAWCPHCSDQVRLFQDGGKYLPFIEVTNPDRTPNQIATDEGITEYPTWEFPDGSRLTGVQSLQTLSQRSGVAIPQSSTPSIAPLDDVSVAIGSPLHIPIDAYDPNGNPLTITVTSSNPSLLDAQVISGNRSWRLSTQNFGDMVFELFEDKAPRPTARIIELTESGFYDGVPFHRVVNNFVIQGGDKVNQDGTGGSPLGQFDDQFHLDLQHNRTGVLSYAKSSDDTNDSQFFITEGPQRFLDFNHSVFGQLVEGEAVREAISNTAVNNSTQNRPVNPVIITSATIFTDNENGVIMLKPTGTGSGTSVITVTVTDTEGNSTSQTFNASVVQDTANGAPFLNDIPTVQAEAGVPTTINLTAQDKEGDTLIYSVTKLGTEDYTLSVNSSTGAVSITAPAGFSGELKFRATVRQTTTPTTSSPDDNQVVTVNVTQSSATPAPTALELLPDSDSGASSTDNITNAQTLNFVVSGTTVGATVEVLASGNVVGTATASGTTTNVQVNNVAALGQGSILFTARQRVSGTNSAPSAGLAAVLDNQAPSPLPADAIPATVRVAQPLTVDLNHAEESQGVVYALVGPPAGMTIDSATGVINWTPSVAQMGLNALTLKLTDLAGNVSEQSFSINVSEEPRVRISLQAVDMAGAPITTVATGQQFKVQVIVKDLRTGTDIPESPTGVFSAYLDLLYDAAIVEPIASNPLKFLDPYLNATSGATSTPGLIDELGAFSDRSSRQGPDAKVLVEVTFVAKAAGNPNLRAEAPDLSSSEVGLYDVTGKVPMSQVEFIGSPFVVGANFVATNDVFNFDEDTGAHVLDVLSNDTAESGAVLTITDVSAPSGGGTVTIAADGKTLSYTSAANFHGAETFTYTVRNQENVPLTATVTVQITDVNDPPIALNDTYTVTRNSTQNILEVLANDSTGVDDPSSETLSVTAVSAGSAGGTIELGPSGLTVRYTPKAGFTGTETFTYTLSDSRGGTATATVSVAVNMENPPPTPQNDTFTLQEDAAENEYDVLINDTPHTAGDTLTISAVGTSQVGSSFSVSADGLKVRYRPAPNFNGTEVLSYTLKDSRGATAQGQVTFNVTAVNDPPNAVNDVVTALSTSTTKWMVLANDTNVDQGETLKIVSVTQPPSGQGTVAISADGSHLIYTGPGGNFEGSFSITYTLDDGTGLTDTATVAATISNYVPRAISGSVLYAYGNQGSGLPFVGIPITLSGTDITGAPVAESTTVDANGAYKFDQLAPGDYQLARGALPFINDTGATVNIQSGVNDGDMVSNLDVSGSLKVGYFDIRDFLGSTLKNSLTVAVNADGSSNWIAPRGDWGDLTTIQAQLDNTTNVLKINASKGTQTGLQASVPLSNNPNASIVGQDSSMQLIRVRGSTTLVGLKSGSTAPAANSASAGQGSTSPQGQSSGGLQGEGEGAAVVAPLVQTTGDSSDSSSGQASQQSLRRSLRSAAEGAATESNELLSSPSSAASFTPAQALRRMLGSNSGANAGDAAMSAAAVDAAMQSVLPALQLQLSDDLSDTLAKRN